MRRKSISRSKKDGRINTINMNINIPIIKTIPKECPWCHKTPIVEKNPLWHGTHGYHGNHEYYVICRNENCKINPKTKSYNDIYNMTEEECINKAIEDWNKR